MTKPHEQHVVVFDRVGTDAILTCYDGANYISIASFVEKQPAVKKGMSQMIPVYSGSDLRLDAELNKVIGVKSETALNRKGGHADVYLPIISIGVMDREGNLFAGHIDSRVPANEIPWSSLSTGKYSVRFQHLLSQAIAKLLGDLVEAENPQERIPAYSQADILGAALLSSYMFVDETKGVQSIIMSRIYLIVDKLVPCHLDTTVLAAGAQENPQAFLDARVIRPITMAEYVKRYGAPKSDLTAPFSTQASVLVSTQATEEWLTGQLKGALDAKALNERQIQAVQDQYAQAASTTPTEISSS